MSIDLGWQEILLRLTLTVVAGTLVGLDRGRHGRQVGLRTTLLVSLAAALAMIQTNVLLPTGGKTAESFATLDLMRLPLGILTGMGFIGAGAIIKKDDIVVGVTTAATLWFVTVIGLCFGGGQIALGLGGLAIGLFVLTVVKRAEERMPRDHRAILLVSGGSAVVSESEIPEEFLKHGFQVMSQGVRFNNTDQTWTLRCEVRWRARPTEQAWPALMKQISQRPGVTMLEWNPIGHTDGSSE